MADLPIDKAACDHVDYCVTEHNGVRLIFAAAVACGGATLRDRIERTQHALRDVLARDDIGGSIVQQTVYAGADRLSECRRFVLECCAAEMPSISFAAQSPCGGESIAIEAVAVEKNDRVQMDRIDDQLVVVRHAGLRWAYCSPHTFDLVGQDVRKATTLALERLGSRLADVDMRCEDVVRTWFFIGGILRKQGNSLHYEAFNRARAEVYQGVFSAGRGDASARDYPASTAVGADGRGVGLRAIAVKGRGEDRVAIPLENPRQTSAYAYDFDDPSTNPAFSRATVVGDVDCATIFISGTASIVGHETYHVEDVVAQTHETIDNIEALIAEANFQRHGLSDGGTSLAGLCQVHVFLKRGDDYAVVKAICEQRLGRVPMVFTVADLCRPGLLVEMDGVAICRHRG